MLPDPVTSVIVARIFTEVAAGMALRAIARGLTYDGIPTPTGRLRWVGDTIRWLVQEGRYWGAGEALSNKELPVEKHLRARYAGKMRTVRREHAERIPVPTWAVPPLVTPELAAQAHARLADHQTHAQRNNRYPERALLRGGLARCGYCGGPLYANNRRSPYGVLRTTYLCSNRDRAAHPDCQAHGIEAHLLDDAAWAKACAILQTPGLIEQEREYLRTSERPGADALAAIDKLIANLSAQIARKRRLFELTDDEQTQNELAEEINDLAALRRAHEAERVNAEVHYADWQQQQAGLDYALAWRERVASKLASASTYEEKRRILEAAKVEVRLWRADRKPERARIWLRFPLSGVISEELSLLANCNEKSTSCLAQTRSVLT